VGIPPLLDRMRVIGFGQWKIIHKFVRLQPQK